MKFLWFVTAVCCVIGALLIIVVFPKAGDARIETAIIMLGIACAVIPYCFTMAIQQMKPAKVVIQDEDD